MSNIFQDLLNNQIEDEYITEAAYPVNIPYNKMIKKQVFLPQGSPVGRGVICFLYTHNFDESFELMTNPSNLLPKNKYHYYYYNKDYIGKILGKNYKFRDYDIRKKYYDKVRENTNILPIINLNNLQNNKNIFFDLHRYIEIFEHTCYNFQQVIY